MANDYFGSVDNWHFISLIRYTCIIPKIKIYLNFFYYANKYAAIVKLSFLYINIVPFLKSDCSVLYIYIWYDR